MSGIGPISPPTPLNLWVGPVDINIIGAGAVNPVQNMAFLQAFQVAAPFTANNITFFIGAIADGNVDAGIFDDGLGATSTLLGSSGSTAVGASTYVYKTLNLTAPVLLHAGVRHWVALAFSSATVQFYVQGGGGLVSAMFNTIGHGQAACFPLATFSAGPAGYLLPYWVMIT